MAQPPEGYKLSRAALRDRFGSRSIDARAKQSANDMTPSGRQKYFEQQYASKGPARALDMATSARDAEWNKQFPFQIEETPTPIKVSNFQPPQVPNANNMFASPEDISSMVQAGATGRVQTPYGPVTLGLLPETQNGPEAFAPFLPQTNSPLSSFSTPNRMFRQPNKWSTSLFG